jgi:hypothetical protein
VGGESGSVGGITQDAMLALSLPHLYCNSFQNTGSLTEVTCLLQFGPRPIAVVSIPYSVAKSLSAALMQIVKTHEENIGEEISSVEELFAKLGETKHE